MHRTQSTDPNQETSLLVNGIRTGKFCSMKVISIYLRQLIHICLQVRSGQAHPGWSDTMQGLPTSGGSDIQIDEMARN